MFGGSCPSCYYLGKKSKCSHAVEHKAVKANASSAPDSNGRLREYTDVSPSRTAGGHMTPDEAPSTTATFDQQENDLRKYPPQVHDYDGSDETSSPECAPRNDNAREQTQRPSTAQGSTGQQDPVEMPDMSITALPEQPSVHGSENRSGTRQGAKMENNVIIPHLDAHSRWDLEVAGGKVVSRVLSAATSPPSLLLPSLCHPHIHLDKPYLLSCHHQPSDLYPNYEDLAPKSGSFQEALSNTSAAKARYTPEDLYLRGSQLLAESCGRHGVTAARTFVEVDHVVKFQTLETAIQLKEDFEHLIDIQICVFAQDPIFSTDHGDENRQLLLEAIDRFGEHISALGTTPYVEQGADASKKARAETKNIEWAIDTAIENGLHLDFHLDYNLDETKQSSVFKVISRLRDYDWLSNAQPGKTIVIGHCTQLTTRTDELDRLQALITEAPELPIHFVGLPTSDLFMMGRPEPRPNGQGSEYIPHARSRGTMQIPSMIKDFGLNGCLGVNNVGNAFTPYGNGDPLQLACWGTGIYQAGAVGDPELLYECVSVRARRAIGLLPPAREEQESEGEDNDAVPLPGLLIRNFQEIELPGRDGGKLTVPARQRLSVRDVVWDPPDTNLRDVLR